MKYKDVYSPKITQFAEMPEWPEWRNRDVGSLGYIFYSNSFEEIIYSDTGRLCDMMTETDVRFVSCGLR